MSPIIRDLLLSDLGPAVRLLEECRGLPDTKPADVVQFVNDVSSGAPGVVAIDGDQIVGVVQARAVGDEAWINVVMIDPKFRQMLLLCRLSHVPAVRLAYLEIQPDLIMHSLSEYFLLDL